MSDSVDKRTFLAGQTCLAKGWYANHTKEELTPGLKWRFYAGSDIAAKAREWLGIGQMIRRTPLAAAVEATAAAIRDPNSALLFEGTFKSHDCIARADALRRADNGWNLLEIKAGLAPSDGKPVKDEYVDDITYTTWVARSAGLIVSKSALVLLNREYRLNGQAPMFVEVDITDLVEARIGEFGAQAAAVVSAAIQPTRPAAFLHFACKDCDYFTTRCVGVGVNDPLFVIPRLSQTRFEELRTYERISRLPEATKLTAKQQEVVNVFTSDKAKLDSDGLQLLDTISCPVYYLDFEAISPYLPWFPNRPPYDATPFQYSLHVRASLDTDPEHLSYLAPTNEDWRRELVGSLLDALGSTGSIVVYSSYEQTRLRALTALFPEWSSRIEAVIARLFDLKAVVEKGFVHPGFGGRTSIKNVLPVVAPDLGYDALAVGNGDDAAAVFALMYVGETPEVQHASLRTALEQYCHLDTLAMVKLHDFLLKARCGVD